MTDEEILAAANDTYHSIPQSLAHNPILTRSHPTAEELKTVPIDVYQSVLQSIASTSRSICEDLGWDTARLKEAAYNTRNKIKDVPCTTHTTKEQLFIRGFHFAVARHIKQTARQRAMETRSTDQPWRKKKASWSPGASASDVPPHRPPAHGRDCPRP